MVDRSAQDAAQMRLVAVVMALTAILWLAANWAGQRFGWPSKYAYLADLAAIGGAVCLDLDSAAGPETPDPGDAAGQCDRAL